MSDPGFDTPASNLESVDNRLLMPGAILAAERQMQGWSVEEVAAQLNLAPRQIHAIEADNYSALPGMACVRGFIRNYAKTLKIDSTPLLALIPGDIAKIHDSIPIRKVVSGTFSESPLPIRQENLPSRSVTVLFVFGLVIGIGLFVHYLGLLPDGSTAVTTKLKSIVSSNIVSASAGVTSNVTGTKAIIMDNGMGNVEPDHLSSNRDMAASASTTSSVPVTTPNVASQQAPTLSSDHDSRSVQNTSPNNMLVLKLREDSWVEIMRHNKVPLISKLVKAGSTESIEITEPVSLTIGNASGVDVMLRGVPIELKSSTKTNVVRLNLK